ncbi:DUF1217 domain-containing protein [Oceanibaculum pacificum]|uniref:Flagellar protein n=1 Tax=Oceanibaculum pacificum TaxID=580166 RepID=A0A154WGX3_9PROT|nr:DUF1217 domain-containing protein [Oceanibaculum pacificum]KZD12725.1 hypothetical protein AUP43_04000 [Oceanibaculum pacificum]
MVANVAFMSGLPGLTTFNMLQQNPVQQLDQFAKTAQIVREVEYFKKAAAKITNVDDFMKDRRLVTFALSAFGLDEEIQYPARLQKVLESPKDDPAALANRLADPRYREISQAFAFGDEGMDKLSDPAFLEDVAQKYILNEFEKTLGQNNPALREATYFLRNIGNASTAYDVLGDPVLRSVVTYTLGLPTQIAVQSVETQARLIDARFDISKYKSADQNDTISGANGGNVRVNDARNDQKLLTEGVALSTKALKQVDSIIEQIELLKAGYGALDAVQDPAGEYQDEIPVQEQAIPGLLRQQGLLEAARESLGRLNGYVARQQALVDLAADPANANKLDSYKTEFAELTDKITAAVGQATYSYDDGDPDAAGTLENLLDGTLGNIAVEYTSGGDILTARGQDLTGFLSGIAQANASFQNVSDADDAANLSTARGALAENKTELNTVRLEVQTDLNELKAGIDSVEQFAASLNSAALYPGAEAVRDAGSRLTQVNILLGELRVVATKSTGLAVDADRSALQTQYDDIVNRLSDVINTTGTPGLANLLAGGNQSYELLDGFNLEARGRDFNASILGELAGRDVSSLGNAQELLGALDKEIGTATGDAFREIATDASVFNLASEKLDPRSGVDSAYSRLASTLEDIIGAAAVGDRNLLSASQSDVRYRVETTGRNLTIDAIDLDGAFGAILRDAVAGLPSDGGDSSGAIAALDTALFSINRLRGELNNDLIAQNSEKKVVDGFIAQQESVVAEREFADPYANISQSAIDFVKRYLTLKDSEAISTNLGLSNAKNAYVLNLVQPINFNFDV